MAAERSIAIRSAGQPTSDLGNRFFTAMERTFNAKAGADATSRAASSGLRPCRQLADGDGR